MSHNSTAKVDQKEYLKKYLSGEKSKKKKKKKDKSKDKEKEKLGKRSRIIDDDATAFQNDGNSDDEVLLYDEDAPQIVGEYIETNNADKWRSIAAKDEKHLKQEHKDNDDDDRWGKRAKIKDETAKKIKREITPDISPPRRANRRKGDSSDNSPPRARRHKGESPPPPRNRRNGVEKDSSPPRKNHHRQQTDLSPPRKRNNSSSPPSRQRQMRRDQSPIREQRNNSVSPQRINRFAVQSPPHRRRGSLDQSPQRRRQFSPPNRQKNRFSPNFSPTRRGRNAPIDQRDGRRNSSQNPHRSSSPQNRKRPNFGGNFSPKQRQTDFSRNNEQRQSPSRFRQRSRSFDRSRNNNNSWNSTTTQRQNNYKNPFAQQNRLPHHNDQYGSPEKRRQMSPPRRRGGDDFPRNLSSDERNRRPNWNKRSDESFERSREMSDQSPSSRRRNIRSPWNETRRASSPPPPAQPARTIIHWETAAEVAQRKARNNGSGSPPPPPTHRPKETKTLDGKKAGLQDARALKEETSARRKDEEKKFAQMSSELSGRDAEVQVRNTGRRGRRGRDAKEEDPEKVREKEEREQKRKEKYDRWGKGLKQIEDHRAKLADQEYESNKPLARYADDEDLDRHLREKERAEDPMLDYVRRKKKDAEKKKGSKSKVPVYEGSYPENRFGIRPGHRWDGVDRSNGYEKKWFDVQSDKRATKDDAYKYSVEDM